MTQIYIDMDGVLADFDGQIKTMYPGKLYEAIQEQFWNHDCAQAGAFCGMKPIEEGIQMVHAIANSGVPICFMTSTGGMPHHIDIAIQKLGWLERYGLGMHPVAFCMNTNGKARYSGEFNILIDDRTKVLEAWRAQGGIGVLFTRETAQDVVKLVLEIFHDYHGKPGN